MTVAFTIWKFPLPLDADEFTIDMPSYIHLSLGVQHDVPCLWGSVIKDPEDNKPYPHRFVWVGTGQIVPEAVRSIGVDFVGTVQLHGGDLVLHLFRVEP